MQSNLAFTSAVLPALLLPALAFGEARSIGPDAATGTSAAVVVVGGDLAHTAQILPLDREGRIVGAGDPDRQTDQVLQNLRRALAQAGSDLDRIVKLNVYVADEELGPRVTAKLAQTFRGPLRPAAAFVVTALPHRDALVAMDAVAASSDVDRALPRKWAGLPDDARVASVAVLPAGRAVYVSGMADRGSLPEATAGTMRKLDGVLRFAGLDRQHVVQVKAFLKPMTDAAVATEEIVRYFDGQQAPPLVLVEWKDGLPIEIELIAAVPAAGADAPGDGPHGPVRHLWPPGADPSPVFSRLAIAEEGPRIYVSGFTSRRAGSGEEQVRDIFDRLQDVLRQAGGDFEHLVKATYYTTDAETSRALTEVRRELYDPQRPPAASRATVRSVADADRTISIDMIAVPAKERR